MNGTSTPKPCGLIGRVALLAQEQPDAPAVSSSDVTLSYRTFAGQVARRATALAANGVVTGSRVGLLLPRGHEGIVTAFACWVVGSAFVSLDPDLPVARLEFMMRDADLTIVVSDGAGDGGGFSVPTIALDELDRTAADRAPALADPDRSDLLAYVIYTSGSTGTPKGVAVAHRTLRYFVEAFDDVLANPGPQGVWIAGAPLSFDMCVPEVIGALTTGGHVVVRDRLEPLAPIVERHRGTHLQCTPSQLALFAAYPTERAALAKLDHLIVAGEALPVPLAVDVRSLLRGRFTNAYGPTEITVYAFSHDIVSPPTGPVPIGRPFAGTSYWILGEDRRPVPQGAVGELVIGGAGVSLGYLGRPELNARLFVELPLGDDGAAERVYVTGDLVCERADGDLEFHGRTDHQVKVRGFRIELGEVEAVLMKDPAVLLAAVIPLERADNDVRLCAYVSSREGAVADGRALLERCREELPWYMVPASADVVDALPRTATGKVDRVALASAAQERLRSSVFALGEASPSDDPLVVMCHLWAGVLGTAVGPDDDFFAKGGHSLIGIELLIRVGDRFGGRLPLGTLVEAPTPRALLGAVTAGDRVFRSLVTLRPGVGQATVIVHGAGGYLLRLHALAQALSPGRPVLGLQAHGLDGAAPPDASLAEMARRYLGELAVDDVDIGALVGYSGGGLVAYEMAAQQRRHGIAVAPVVMIDADVPSGRTPTRADHWWNLLVNVITRGPRIVVSWWKVRRSRRIEAERRRIVRREVAEHGFVDIQDHLEALMAAYAPARLQGAVGLVMASDVRPTERPDYDWERLVDGPFAAAVCVGDHFSMLEPPDVASLAVTIDGLIAQLVSRSRP